MFKFEEMLQIIFFPNPISSQKTIYIDLCERKRELEGNLKPNSTKEAFKDVYHDTNITISFRYLKNR